MHRREVRLAFSLFLGLGLAGSVVGCEEEFSDEPFGTLDLAPVYDGGTPSDPAAGIPEQIRPARGYLDGQVAEYYDFGTGPQHHQSRGRHAHRGARAADVLLLRRRRSGRCSPGRCASCATAPTGSRAGTTCSTPTPRTSASAPPTWRPARRATRRRRRSPIPSAVRDPLVDPDRGGSDDYQRPADRSHARRTATRPGGEYTGLWEIVEVTTPDGYEPDSIKHVATLDQAVASGKFKQRPTGKVINCPLIDERTYVLRGITSRRTFRPRIELWYRRQLATCFLANGWETLGRRGWHALVRQLRTTERLDTFDVARVTVGTGTRRAQELVVPVGRAYEPASRHRTSWTDAVTTPPARQHRHRHAAASPSRSDPPGYTPDALDVRRARSARTSSPGTGSRWRTSITSRATPRPESFVRPHREATCPCAGWRCSAPSCRTTAPPTTSADPKMQCGKRPDLDKPTGNQVRSQGRSGLQRRAGSPEPEGPAAGVQQGHLLLRRPRRGLRPGLRAGHRPVLDRQRTSFSPKRLRVLSALGRLLPARLPGRQHHGPAEHGQGTSPSGWTAAASAAKGFICFGTPRLHQALRSERHRSQAVQRQRDGG